MTATIERPRRGGAAGAGEALDLRGAAALDPAAALRRLGSDAAGLSGTEAARRLAEVGPNVLRSHGVRAWQVLVRQLRSYLLLLLIAAAVVSAGLGDLTQAAIILVIVALSVGLGFLNEYRSEQAVEALHAQIRRRTVVRRDGGSRELDITELVPGDVVELRLGDVVPADLRLLEASALECDESVLTGEAAAAAKDPGAAAGASALELPSCALMGTVVRGGSGLGVVVGTGARTAFGAIALRLGERHEQTAFQRGLTEFSRMLFGITAALAASIFVINVGLGRSLLESSLFALAIAVGLTPQLLPAIVTVSLATGARRLAARQVVVKRLVCIEDLGNVDVLFTDKTGTLTEGRIAFTTPLDAAGHLNPEALTLGLVCNEATPSDQGAVGGNSLDRALWDSPEAGHAGAGAWRTLARLPFDHERQLASVLAAGADGAHVLVTKGAPEAILARCAALPTGAQAVLDGLFAAGERVVAVATRSAAGQTGVSPGDEHGLELRGFLCFADPPKADAAASLTRLAALGVDVKIVTGDNGRVAEKVCADLGMPVAGMLTGAQLDALDDTALEAALPQTTIFARVTPEQKSRVLQAQRRLDSTVGFLGDGVNDAIALHDADVGISVDTASDVAKDAADVVLLAKDLSILADGVAQGRRIFANTIKYVLMGTSSNFGNMFSAAGASLFLNFLPMLPSQILLNNLLYDVSELTIPTDEVDEELLARPSQWDVRFIRRFMAFFGPISSIYDFLTFAVMIWIFHAHAPLFRSGWFVESLATQSLVIFAIRTRRVPFFHSRPSRPLLVTTLACAAVGIALPYSPVAHLLGFRALPLAFLGALALMVVTYLALVEIGKSIFFRTGPTGTPLARPAPGPVRRVSRLAAGWSRARLNG